MEAHGFDVDLILGPRLSARRAWVVAGGAGALSLILATALVLVLPLKQTQVFTVLVDRQTGDAEKVMTVAPTGIEDQEALKQSLLVAYVSDREGYFLAGIQARLESVQRRSTAGAEESLRSSGPRAAAMPPIRPMSMARARKCR
jgi:type IV secretory pathway component VirB8